MKIKKCKKATLAALMLCSLSLFGCSSRSSITNDSVTNESTIIENNLEETKVNNISYSITASTINIDRSRFGDYEEVDENMYAEINAAINEDEIDALFIKNIDNQIEFNRINLKGINMLWIEYPQKNFDYEVFESASYANLSITIDTSANIETLANFLANVKLKNGLVSLNFKEDISIPNQQKCLKALENNKDLSKLQIYSNVIDQLAFKNLKPLELTLYSITANNIIDYTFDINKDVNYFIFMPCYDEEYTNTPVIKSITINSKNEDLETSIFVYKPYDETFKGIINKDTKINIENSNYLYLNGVNLEDFTIQEFRLFKDFNYVYITNQDNYKVFFEYSKESMTLDEAINAYEALIKEKEKTLKPE